MNYATVWARPGSPVQSVNVARSPIPDIGDEDVKATWLVMRDRLIPRLTAYATLILDTHRMTGGFGRPGAIRCDECGSDWTCPWVRWAHSCLHEAGLLLESMAPHAEQAVPVGDMSRVPGSGTGRLPGGTLPITRDIDPRGGDPMTRFLPDNPEGVEPPEGDDTDDDVVPEGD